ncbi:MAG: phosphonoacetaldehyde reductase [Candidatus Thorarchaeota archaeon]
MTQTKVYFASGRAVEYLSQIIHDLDANRIFIVTGKNLYSLSGAKDTLEQTLEGLDVKYYHYPSPNPTIEDIHAAIEKSRAHNSQIIIGLGGGTAMDIAKATRAFVPNLGNPADYIINKNPFQSPSQQTLVQIPTTAGTGSEITQFAVVYIEGTKYSLDNPLLKAEYCILDPQLTTSMTPKLTVITALDALSQAIESLWSIKSTEESRTSSIEALKLIAPRIEKLASELTLDDREALLTASHLAGQAIAVTRTTAAHAISYSLTSKYDVPHGLAVALTLPSFFNFNYDVDAGSNQDTRGVEFVREQIETIAKLLGQESVTECVNWLKTTIDNLGISLRLRDYGIEHDSIRKVIVPSFNEERGKNNPRRVTKSDLTKILMEIL